MDRARIPTPIEPRMRREDEEAPSGMPDDADEISPLGVPADEDERTDEHDPKELPGMPSGEPDTAG
ncbi:MAG: hypothetical protein Q8O56_16380 [Solirubrobacteraceae bacterium]|nr:hypothetical protein [Solirubrobacteraceae bacterium]